MPKTKRYVESTDDDSSESDSDASSVEAPPKKAKGVVLSNKTIDPSKVPPKPLTARVKKASKAFSFKLTFTNGALLRKFLEPSVHAVKKIRFVINDNPTEANGFRGFKIECHDQWYTLADSGLYECDVDAGTSPVTGSVMGIHGETFCVASDAFMEALVSSTLKETDLSIARYHDTYDRITFESINNENDVRALYTCDLIEASQVQNLDGMEISLGFHVSVHMGTLKELSLNAKRCGAQALQFELFQADDPKDANLVHSRMSIGFKGPNINGVHDFFLSTRRHKNADGTNTWEPMSGLGLAAHDGLDLVKKCSNEYDNKKLRLFLNHMDCPWVLVHLCNDNSVSPLVLDCVLGGKFTKHTVIVAPKEPGS